MRTGLLKFANLSIILFILMPFFVTASASAASGTETRITTDESDQTSAKNVDREISIKNIIDAIFGKIFQQRPFYSGSSPDPAAADEGFMKDMAAEESGAGFSEKTGAVPAEKPRSENFSEEGPGEEYPPEDLPQQEAIANPVHAVELTAEEVHEEYAVSGPGVYPMSQGDILRLPGDYELLAKLIDVEGGRAWLEFEKNGDFVDDEILSIPDEETVWDLYSYSAAGNEELIYRVRLNDVSADRGSGIVVVDIEFM